MPDATACLDRAVCDQTRPINAVPCRVGREGRADDMLVHVGAQVDALHALCSRVFSAHSSMPTLVFWHASSHALVP